MTIEIDWIFSIFSPVLWNLRLDKVDFNFYHDAIIEFLDDFNQIAPSAMSRIDYSQLLRLIIQRIPPHSLEHFALELKYLMPTITTMKMNRLDFLTIIPALIYLESTCYPKRGLFRFRENSILDLHLTRKLIAWHSRTRWILSIIATVYFAWNFSFYREETIDFLLDDEMLFFEFFIKLNRYPQAKLDSVDWHRTKIFSFLFTS